jgi:hypothetical protein
LRQLRLHFGFNVGQLDGGHLFVIVGFVVAKYWPEIGEISVGNYYAKISPTYFGTVEDDVASDSAPVDGSALRFKFLRRSLRFRASSSRLPTLLSVIFEVFHNKIDFFSNFFAKK